LTDPDGPRAPIGQESGGNGLAGDVDFTALFLPQLQDWRT
jgi:hypothetical protein